MEDEGQAKVVYGVVSNITVRKQAEEGIRRYAERLRVLHEIDKDIGAAQSQAATAQTVLKRLRRLLPGQQARVDLFDFERQEVVILAAGADPGWPVQMGLRQPLESAELATLRQGQVWGVEDLAALAQPSALLKTLLAEGGRSLMKAPLLAGDELLGAVCLASNRPGAFKIEQTELAQEISGQLAIALQQAACASKSTAPVSGWKPCLIGCWRRKRLNVGTLPANCTTKLTST